MSRDNTPQDRQAQPDLQKTTSNTAQGQRGSAEAQERGKVSDALRSPSEERQRDIAVGREEGRQARSTGTLGVSRPQALLQRLSEDVDRLFDQFGFARSGLQLSHLFDRHLWADRLRNARADQALWSPQVEVFRRDGNLVVRADLPGVKKDDLQVDVDNDVLTVSGERFDEHEDRRDDFFRSERSYGQFFRAIPLPDGVKPEDVKATFTDGVLEITAPVPSAEPRQSRRVEVR